MVHFIIFVLYWIWCWTDAWKLFIILICITVHIHVCVSVYLCVCVSVHVVHKEGCAFPCQDCMKGIQHLGLEILIREDLKFKEKKIIFHNMPLIKIRSNSLKNNSVNKKLPNSYLVKLTFLSMLLLLTALMDLMNVDFV